MGNCHKLYVVLCFSGLSYDWVDHVLYSSSSGTNASPGKIMAVNVDSGILSDEKTNLIHPLHVLVVPLERLEEFA